MKYQYKSMDKSESFDLNLLQNPDVIHFPMFCWGWDCDINKEVLAERLYEYKSNNICQLYILPKPHAFRPVTGNNMQPDYLTKEYFDIIRYLFELADKLGMKLWIYDEGGLPSGSACGKVLEVNPSLYRKQIMSRVVASPYKKGDGCISAFCDGKRVYEGFSSESDIVEYYFETVPGDYPNLLEVEATDTFIKLTHDEYKKYVGDMFGKAVTSVFTDEPVAEKTSWCEGFEKEFFERYGYDISDYIPYIVSDSNEDTDTLGQKIRIDYYDFLAEVFCKSYFLRLREWCRNNGLIFTGHLDNDNATYDKRQRFYHMLRQLRSFDMPGIDMIWRQIFPGKDNHFYPRFASSAAVQTGNRFSVSESFAVYGAGLTFEQMRYLILYQMVRGINVFNFMSMSYSYSGLNRRGARPGFDKRIPTWRHLAAFNLYTARMCYITSLGRPYADIAVYLPMKDIWAGGKRMETAIKHFDELVYSLEARGFCIDIIDDDFLESSYVDGRFICTGEARYDKLYIPSKAAFSEDIEAKLEVFASEGGLIIDDERIESTAPSVILSSSDIIVSKRETDVGSIYLLHNQSSLAKEFSATFPEDGHVYEIDIVKGTLYELCTNHIELCAGEGKFILISNSRLTALTKKSYHNCMTVGSFEMRRASQFIIGENDFVRVDFDDEYIKTVPEDWCKSYGEDFSGEVIYRINFDFEAVPDSIEVDLGEVKYSCDVEINGFHIADLCFTPFRFDVEKKYLRNKNEMLVRVANTNANAVGAAKFLDEIPAEIIGQYHSIAKQFERESLESGLLSEIKIYY